MKSYDFFIAYATEDYRPASELKWLLEDEGFSVFLDRSELNPGTVWPEKIREALASSSAILLIVSAKTDRAFFQQDELQQALEIGRQVIPIRVGQACQLPYGTGILQSIDGNRAGGLERVVRELARRFDGADPEVLPTAPLKAASYRALGAALRLDRYPQWSGVLEESSRPGHVLFLLHGARDQNVALFVERIQRYLSQEIHSPHRVFRVRFQLEGITARCSADWERHLRFALGGQGSAISCLRQAAKNQAVFLTLGLRPLDLLDEEQQQGLGEFLEKRFPKLLRTANPQYEIRTILALDYATDNGPQPLVEKTLAWGRRAERSGQLRFVPLPKVVLPSWSDVQMYLSHRHPPPSSGTMEQLQKEYRQLKRSRTLSFQQLADMLDRYLQDA